MLGNKYLIYILTAFLLLSSSFAYTINGNTVYYDSIYANMSVTPHTVYNPSEQWQYFTVHSKASAGELCVAYVFNESLNSGSIELWSLSNHPYKYCLDEECLTYEIRDNYYEDWQDVSLLFENVNYLGKRVYYHNIPLSFNAWDNHTWRIQYNPKANEGKWDLWTWNSKSGSCYNDFITNNYDFYYELDPWWNGDVNQTTGFVYLTIPYPYPYHDTARDYTYNTSYSLDSDPGFVLSRDAQNLVVDSSNFVEGTASISWENNPALNINNYARIYRSVLSNVSIEKYDTLGFWFYINDSRYIGTSPTGRTFFVAFYDNVGYNNYFDIYNSSTTYIDSNKLYMPIVDGWNKIEIPISSITKSAFYDGWIQGIRIQVYTDMATNNETTISALDNFYVYNSSNYLDKYWDMDETGANINEANIQLSDNGFGSDTPVIAVSQHEDIYDDISFDMSNFTDDFEVIVKVKMLSQTSSSTVCDVSLYDGSYGYIRQYLYSNNARLYSRDDDSNTIDSSFDVGVGNWVYFRFLKNGTTMYHYYTDNLESPENSWVSIQNYTLDTRDVGRLWLTSRLGTCEFDNIVIRRVIPDCVCTGNTFVPSFIYDSADEDEWDYTRIRTYKDDVSYNTVYNYNPTDHDVYNITFSGYGDFYQQVRVYDIHGVTAYNYTQTLEVGLANININIYNETDKTQHINDTLYVELINEGYDYYNQSIVTNGQINFTRVPYEDFEIRYYGTNYNLRNYFGTLAYGETLQLDLYASKTSNYLDVYVLDFGLSGIRNATVTIQKWDATTGTGSTVAMGKTNTQGIKRFYLDITNNYYKIIVSYEGTTIYSTDWEVITGLSYRIITDLETLYYQWGSLDGILNFDNSTKIFSLTYNNKESTISKVCLEVEKITAYNNYSTINTTCSNSASSSIYIGIDGSYTHYARAYYVSGNGQRVPIDDLQYTVLTAYQNYWKKLGLLIGIVISLVIIFGILYISQSLIGAIIAMDISIIALWITGLYPFDTYTLGILIPGSFVIMYYLNKVV